MQKNQRKLHVASAKGAQPETINENGATGHATNNATTSLKALVLLKKKRNCQNNSNETQQKQACNFTPDNSLQKLHSVTAAANGSALPEVGVLDALRNDKDIELLSDDFIWLASLLVGTTLQCRRELLGEYKCQWLDGMDKVAHGHQQQNAGRKQANTWIRHKIKQ